MSKIIFNNNPSIIYDGSFSQIGTNQVRLVFDSKIPSSTDLLSGFNLINEYNGFIQTKREDYIYIYRTYDDNPLMIELCNNNIEYVEPEPIVIPEPEPYIPAYEEVLQNKINELSLTCQNLIVSGLDINGLHYSYSAEDQTNLKEIFDTVKITGLPMGYHADGQGCTEYTAEELINIYIQLTMNKYCQQTYFNQSRSYLESLENTEENKDLISSYEYGTPLLTPYLDKYNSMIALYNAQIQAMIPTSE